MINRRAKNIIVPKDGNSMNLLLQNDENLGDYTVLSVPVSDLKVLFDSDLFEEINKKFDILIEDYEEEGIYGMSKLIDLIKILEKFKHENSLVVYYKQLIYDCVNLAISYDTGVFFYF